jgi:hypothetical protein
MSGMISGLIRQSFSRPPRLFIWRKDGVSLHLDGKGTTYVIVARELCRFKTFAQTGDLGESKVKAALALKIRDWAPFDNAEHIAVPGPNLWSVWAWDRQAGLKAAAAAGLSGMRLRFLPETLFAEPAHDAIRMVEALSGFEGQVWRQGAPVESRWWREKPQLAEWIGFQRSAGVKPDRFVSTIPQPVTSVLLDRPWAGTETSPFARFAQFTALDWTITATVLAALPMVFFLFQLLAVDTELAGVTAESDKMRDRAAPVLTARGNAIAASDRVRGIANLDAYPAQVTIMRIVAANLPNDDTKVTEWNYQNGDLEFNIQGPETIDIKSLVQRLEGTGALSDVTVERVFQAGVLRVKLKVLTKEAAAKLRAAAQLAQPAAPPAGPPGAAQIAPVPGAIPVGPPQPAAAGDSANSDILRELGRGSVPINSNAKPLPVPVPDPAPRSEQPQRN